MLVNNFDKLTTFFDRLENSEDFYYIQIIQRKKDGHIKSEHTIKTYYIYNKEQFLSLKSEIIELCEKFNARAYFWVNPRNARKVSLECIKLFATHLEQNSCTSGQNVWDKCCGKNPASNYVHYWIVDIDNSDPEYLLKIIRLIHKCRCKELPLIKDIIPTVNGCHILTCGFDLHHFKQLCMIDKIDIMDIHKDNPTILYYAKNERQDM